MPIMKEIKEMLYLFGGTVLLEDSKVRAIFPTFKETPLNDAIEETLTWYKINQLPK
jgi:hypothetical protein